MWSLHARESREAPWILFVAVFISLEASCAARPASPHALTIGRQHCYELHAEVVAASGSDGRQQLHFDRVTARDRISMMRGLQVIRLHCGRLANITEYRFGREAAKIAPGR